MSAPTDIGEAAAVPPRAAACALLDGAVGLAAWPGLALVLDRDGTVLAANDAAAALIAPAPQVMLSRAVARGRPGAVTVMLGPGAGSRRFDCTVMPLAPAKWRSCWRAMRRSTAGCAMR